MVGIHELQVYLRQVNEQLPTIGELGRGWPYPFSEADIHDLLCEMFTQDGLDFYHEYHCQETHFKLDFLFPETRIGLELKVGTGNVNRLAVTEMICALPYCHCLILANYHQKAPKTKRLSVWSVSDCAGIQLRIPMSSANVGTTIKKQSNDFKVHVLGNLGDPAKRRSWPPFTMIERYWATVLIDQDLRDAISLEAPKQAIQRMHFPEVH